MINDRRFLLVFSLVVFFGRIVAGADEPARNCPVLLTFDVAIEADIAAFNALNPPGSCTIFVTGEFRGPTQTSSSSGRSGMRSPARR